VTSVIGWAWRLDGARRRPHLEFMQMRLSRISGVILVGVLMAGAADAAPRHNRQAASSSSDALVPMENGTPVIMKGYHPPKLAPEEAQPRQRPGRTAKIPRGSSSFVDIPPVNPSPYSSNSPPVTVPTVQPYNPPPINSFGDRVTGAIHAFPLERGLGNNPNDLQSFIRQRANQ
jgi:hypothetical protein